MSPHTVKWGIISTGGIATNFTTDLLVDPSTRGSDDVAHVVAAVGSRSVASAQSFIDKLKDFAPDHPSSWGAKNGVIDQTKAYGSYSEVFRDPNVDVVYIGTPHTFHHANAKEALQAGKHVLCEKPVTFDMEELEELLAIAKEKNLFFMEAVWTRFHPIAYDIQQLVHSGKLGKVKRFIADNSLDFKPDTLELSHRMLDPKLGGGALLDLGPYPSVWAMLVMHQHPDNADRAAPALVNSHQTILNKTKVDANSRWRLEWENVGPADLACDMTTTGFRDWAVIISCEEADVFIEYPPWRPLAYSIVPKSDIQPGSVKERQRFVPKSHPGGSMHYEADEVARCLRDGKKQSERMPWDESRVVQSWFDKVRKDGNSVLKDVKGTAGQ